MPAVDTDVLSETALNAHHRQLRHSSPQQQKQWTEWTSQRPCLYSLQYSRPSVGLYYPLQPTSLHLPTPKLYRFHLFLPKFVSLEYAFHFINGFQTSLSVKLSSTEVELSSTPNTAAKSRDVKQGAAGGHRETIQPVGISSPPGTPTNYYIDSNSGTLSFNKAVFPSAHWWNKSRHAPSF